MEHGSRTSKLLASIALFAWLGLLWGGTFWLTTAGNVIPGQIVEIRIAIWDVGDMSLDSLAVIDGFKWLPNATLPGTGG